MKKSHILLISLIFSIVAIGCDSGPVCTKSEFVAGASSSTLYYPCTGGPSPATTMTSGFSGTKAAIAWLARDVAAAGYVVLAMTPTNPMGMVSGWRTAHVNGVKHLKALTGKVDAGRVGTCGHSKGGGGALWAADTLGSELQTAIGMAPWHEQFMSLSGIRAATLIQAGTADTLATALMTRGEYNMLPSSVSKAYFTYPVGHMAWGVGNPSLTRDVVAWLDYYLKCDDSARSTLGAMGNQWVDKGNCGSGSSSSSASSSGGTGCY